MKDFFASKQTWGALIYLLAPLLQQAGIEIDHEAVVEAVMQVVGGALFLWGAFSARRAPVGSVAGVKVKKAED